MTTIQIKNGARIIQAIMTGYGVIPYVTSIDRWGTIVVQGRYNQEAETKLEAAGKFSMKEYYYNNEKYTTYERGTIKIILTP